jgi:ParB-like chromosome segregation protein Spo0J
VPDVIKPKLDEAGKPLVHPVAALFPMLGEDELKEMAADIGERGLLQKIVLDKDGRILDGRNRYAACHLAKVEPLFEEYGGDDSDGYALAVNIERRHLSAGARAIIAAQAARLNGQSTREAEGGTNLYHPRITEANQVLDWAPDLVQVRS